MDSNDELKETAIKNRTSYYFDDIMRVIDIGFSDILLNKNQLKNTLIYNVPYKAFIDSKLLLIRFDEIN